jgi:hypothetical protein
MDITLKKEIELYQNLSKLAVKKLPPALSYAISKNMKTMEEDIEIIEKKRMELIETYCTKNDDGTAKTENGTYDLGENKVKFITEYEEYLNSNTELNVRKVGFTELEKTESDRYDVFTAEEIKAIDFMLED